VALALPSSGLHSNGYSLARRALRVDGAGDADAKLAEAAVRAGLAASPGELQGKSLGEALLVPTRLYARAVQGIVGANVDVRAMSHITGGGLAGNVPRVLPDGLGLRIERLWARPAIFDLVKKAGAIEESEMRRTFNMGVGFVFVVAAAEAERAEQALRASGESPFTLGRIVRVPADRPFEERVEWPA
jgi:phosphoribosylformylglycinamidine cyclo-ligase